MNARRRWWIAGIAAVGLALALAACGEEAPDPTPTHAGPTPAPSLAPSPTVDPVLPSGDGEGGAVIGASNPTQAGLAAEGQPDQDLPTNTPPPTQALLPMTISASDGLIIQATYYSAPIRPAPGVLLVPMEGTGREVYAALAERLQAAGYAVLAVDLRGYGDTGGDPDWTLAPADVRDALDMLADFPGVNRGQLAVVGASTGANLALNTCADFAGCNAAVLLSPGLDYHGITTAGAMARMGQRAVLIVAGENDGNNPADSITLDSAATGDHRLEIYPNAGHGTDMLAAQPGLADGIVAWLLPRVPPPEP